MSKITLNVYNKYTKERHKLIKKLCDLKSVLPDDEFLKQLTQNNQFFKNYNKSCFSNYSSKKLNTKTFGKKNTKIEYIKKQIRKADNTVVQAKYDKESSQKIYDGDRKGSLKNEKTKRLNEHNYTITKFFQNASDKIHNTSQLLSSESIEKKSEMLNKHICTKYEARLRWIKNKRHKDSSEFLEQSIEDSEENNRKSVNWCGTRENDYLQSIKIQKDDEISKNNFDNILIQLWKDMCPLSTNSCPRFNIDVSTLPTTSSCKTKNCIVNSNNKHDVNSKKSVSDYESSTKILYGKSRPKQKDYTKWSSSTKKVFNNDDNKNIKEKKKIFPQNEIKNRMSETDNYHKSKQSSFNTRVTKQDKQDYINTNWQSDNKRFYMRKKQRQRSASDWYFRRAYYRRIARKHAEDIYHQWKESKEFWKMALMY